MNLRKKKGGIGKGLTKVSIPSFPMAIPKDTATMIAGSPEESNNEKLFK